MSAEPRSTGPPNVEEIARFLRQRADLGLDEIFLEGFTREQVLRAAAEARTSVHRQQRGAPEHEPASILPSDGDEVEIPAREVDLTVLKYPELKAVAESCQRCRLAKGRTQVVFSDGNPQARLMVVGEAPGANEDRTGLPFVGQAGKFLDLLLASVDLSRKDSVYICNVLKCRPPGNRDPMADEIELCSPFLKRQIALVAPEVILAVGTFAAQLLTGTNRPLGRLRGSVYAYEGVPLVVTYHPAALLRNAGWTRSTWDDFQLLREVMDGS
ncbi:MAG: uracil-DNA glycosylase [Longimicrobiales bacterium]